MTTRPKPAFAPIAPVANLTSELAETMASQIASGQLAPGQRLPTEQAIVAATGVSRTVVREALASLRARGLISTRQGLGAFVATEPPQKSFVVAQAEPPAEELRQLRELRAALVVEAAGLAATRRGAAEPELLRARLAQAGEPADADRAVAADFAFHRAILAAAANPQFGHVFEALADPLARARRAECSAMTRRRFASALRRAAREQAAIVTAIERGDAAAARRAMRRHLASAQS